MIYKWNIINQEMFEEVITGFLSGDEAYQGKTLEIFYPAGVEDGDSLRFYMTPSISRSEYYQTDVILRETLLTQDDNFNREILKILDQKYTVNFISVRRSRNAEEVDENTKILNETLKGSLSQLPGSFYDDFVSPDPSIKFFPILTEDAGDFCTPQNPLWEYLLNSTGPESFWLWKDSDGNYGWGDKKNHQGQERFWKIRSLDEEDFLKIIDSVMNKHENFPTE